MKRLMLLELLVALVAVSYGQERQKPQGQNAVSLGKIAEQIRNGDIDVGKKMSMDFDGRFHTIHAEVLGMDCTSCHASPSYAKDYLFVRKYEFPRQGHPGAVGRATCIGCHQQGGIATPWYGTAAR